MPSMPPLASHHPLPKSLQLTVNMTELMEALGIRDDSEFARRFGIHRRRVGQLQDDTWLEISKRDLQTLMSLDRRNRGKLPHELLSLIPHPLWETFGTTTNGFPSDENDESVVPIDSEVLTVFRKAEVRLRAVPQTTPIPELMTQENCIFVGSPIRNRATEQALRALYPSDSAPFRLLRTDWPEEGGTRFGRRDSKGLDYLDAVDTWHTVRDASDDKTPGPPAGILVACRRPLDSPNPVTTIIIAGCSRLGTQQIAQDLLDGVLFVPPHGLHNGVEIGLKDGVPGAFFLLPNGKTGTRWYDRKLELAHLSRKQHQV